MRVQHKLARRSQVCGALASRKQMDPHGCTVLLAASGIARVLTTASDPDSDRAQGRGGTIKDSLSLTGSVTEPRTADVKATGVIQPQSLMIGRLTDGK
mmetsp:Transcript_16094/g.23979  ORF Transcript_16094/g.23979 Transcript_16094/m.23979 type:complete len:98 (+) Transcript_16094:3-296(+)